MKPNSAIRKSQPLTQKLSKQSSAPHSSFQQSLKQTMKKPNEPDSQKQVIFSVIRDLDQKQQVLTPMPQTPYCPASVTSTQDKKKMQTFAPLKGNQPF